MDTVLMNEEVRKSGRRGIIINRCSTCSKSINMINTINADDLRRLDLNLLPVFAALLQERSTTRAATTLGLGQPAVSAALARLREAFGDPLFTRVPRGLEPTPRALTVAAQLAPAFAAIREALRPPESFDPSKASLTARVGMPDNHEHVIMPALLARLQREAPGVRVLVRQTSGTTAGQLLDDDRIDLACGRIDQVGAWQHRQVLVPVNYLCLYDKRMLRLSGPLTLTRFLAAPHLLVSARGDFEGIVDDALKKLRKTRRVVYATANFSSIPGVLQRIPAIATLPEHAARRFAKSYRLEAVAPPLSLPSYETALVWLTKYDQDPVHRWLRLMVSTVVKAIHEENKP
jgi:DNA-binding transcriptional LysR family regulator